MTEYLVSCNGETHRVFLDFERRRAETPDHPDATDGEVLLARLGRPEFPAYPPCTLVHLILRHPLCRFASYGTGAVLTGRVGPFTLSVGLTEAKAVVP